MFNFLYTSGLVSIKFCEKAVDEHIINNRKKITFLNTELANCKNHTNIAKYSILKVKIKHN